MLRQDLKIALRQSLNKPLFSTLIVAVLGLGIGATTAIFSITDQVLFRGLPVADPDRLVRVFRVDETGKPNNNLSYPAISDLFGLDAFSHVAGYTDWAPFNLAASGQEPARVGGAVVSGEYFEAFGVQPLVGRYLLPSDDVERAGHPVVVLSERAWRGQFGADPAIVGKPVAINTHPFTVVGVMPASFGGANAQAAIDAWVPMAMVEQAAPYDQGRPQRNAMLLLGVTTTLLLIALANAAGLLLVRTDERMREIALRLGLGAPRGRIVRMLVIEALLFAGAGTVVGVAVAWATLSGAVASIAGFLDGAPSDPSQLMHWRVIAFAAALAVVTALASVVSPALRALRVDLTTALKQGAARSGRDGVRARQAAVVVQVALSVALLTVALLLVRSFWQTTAVEPGFEVDSALTVSVDLLRQGYAPDDALRAQQAIAQRVVQSPLVESAAFARIVPIRSGGMRTTFSVDGEQTDAMLTDFNVVSPSYFKTMRIPLLQGRAFADADMTGTERVAVVNEAFAQRFFPDGALGRTVAALGGVTIVGVVADSKLRSLRESPTSNLYVSLAQRPDAQASLIVRGVAGDPWLVWPAVREAARAVDPDLPLFRAKTLADHVGESYLEATVMAWLLAAFAVLAVVLSAAGLYGLLSWQVRARTREIGVRLALGAPAAAVKRAFLKRGLALTVVGIPAGLVAAAWVARGLDELLYGVTATDAGTYGLVVAGFLVVALVATWAPARRSSRIDPMEALRDE